MPEVTRWCAYCDTDISDRHGNARWCATCALQRKLDQDHDYYTTHRNCSASCKGCGADGPHPGQFCSRVCMGKHLRAMQLQTKCVRTCRVCLENTFETSDKRRWECGPACKAWARKFPGVQRVLDRECKHCLSPFRARTGKQFYCLKTCQVAAGGCRRRGRLAKAFVEDVDKGAVAQRDKWKCQLCRRKVDGSLPWPHPMSWSLDHVVPITQGGEHSYANIQLTHLICNLQKHATIRAPQQLALIG